MNVSDLDERLRQVTFTQVTAMTKTHITVVDTQEAIAIIAVKETTVNQEVTAIHLAEAVAVITEGEVTNPAITTGMTIAIQEAGKRHLIGQEEEVTEAMTERTQEEVTLKELQ